MVDYELVNNILLYFPSATSFGIRPSATCKTYTPEKHSEYLRSSSNNSHYRAVVKMRAECDGRETTAIIVQAGFQNVDLKATLQHCVEMKTLRNKPIEDIIQGLVLFHDGSRQRYVPLSAVHYDQEPMATSQSSCLEESNDEEALPPNFTPQRPPLPPPPPLCEMNRSFIGDASITERQESLPQRQDNGAFDLGSTSIVQKWRGQMARRGVELFSFEGIAHLNAYLFKEIHSLREDMKKLKEVEGLCADPSQAESQDIRLQQLGLPLGNVESYQRFKSEIEDDRSLKQLLIKRLCQIGGTNADKHTTNIIQFLLSKSFQTKFNRTGRDYSSARKTGQGKMAFSEILEPLVIEAVMKNKRGGVTENHIKKRIELFLKDAKKRDAKNMETEMRKSGKKRKLFYSGSDSNNDSN